MTETPFWREREGELSTTEFMVGATLSAYELKRLENIRLNEEKLKSLNMDKVSNQHLHIPAPLIAKPWL